MGVHKVYPKKATISQKVSRLASRKHSIALTCMIIGVTGKEVREGESKGWEEGGRGKEGGSQGKV